MVIPQIKPERLDRIYESRQTRERRADPSAHHPTQAATHGETNEPGSHQNQGKGRVTYRGQVTHLGRTRDAWQPRRLRDQLKSLKAVVPGFGASWKNSYRFTASNVKEEWNILKHHTVAESQGSENWVVLCGLTKTDGLGAQVSYKLMRTACTRMKDCFAMITNHTRLADHRPQAKVKNPYMAFYHAIEAEDHFLPSSQHSKYNGPTMRFLSLRMHFAQVKREKDACRRNPKYLGLLNLVGPKPNPKHLDIVDLVGPASKARNLDSVL